MAVLSQTSEYALQATVVLARAATVVEVGALAEALGVPRNYLSKTLSQLVRVGVLESVRGKHGGFRLARPADEIPILAVVEPFERFTDARRCVMGRRICSEDEACAAHESWKAIAGRILRFFRETTVGDLARGRSRWPNTAARGVVRG
jgi:Rrf2 family protein